MNSNIELHKVSQIIPIKKQNNFDFKAILLF